MKQIYKKILENALPYYKKGRKGDIEHVKWLSETIPKFAEKNDLDVLMPLAILHDVGYCRVPKNANPFNLRIRKLHSAEGAKIAEKILNKLNYPEDKIKEIKRLVAKHDNWAFGDSFRSEPLLRLFHDFDFIWMASEKGFDIIRRFTDKAPRAFYKQILRFEKERAKFSDKKIEAFYKKLMRERKKRL